MVVTRRLKGFSSQYDLDPQRKWEIDKDLFPKRRDRWLKCFITSSTFSTLQYCNNNSLKATFLRPNVELLVLPEE